MTLQIIVDFLTEIGIPIKLASLGEHQTFLPGLEIQNGALVVDEAKLLSPGDVLHEAGHLALMTPEERARSNGDVGADPGIEMGAIAWSYAAAVHLGIPAAIVFHEQGYKGGSQSLIETFETGKDVGVPILDWLGLSVAANHAKARGVAAYPVMRKWLRDGDSAEDSLH